MDEAIDVKVVDPPRRGLARAGKQTCCGFDLYSVERVEVKKGTTELLPTGLVLAIPPGWEGQVRCCKACEKKGLILPNGVGTIDADYRGELMVLAHWIGEADSFVVEKGERIGQILLKRVPEIRFVEVEREALDDTERGAGGFGSTGRF